MPVRPTNPGVYIPETPTVPSGPHTITGVATDITAFLGRAVRGPIERPLTIFTFDDFERYYGGLDRDMPMGYAVRDYFLNGGGQAIIVRLSTAQAVAATARGSELHLIFTAISPGSWGNTSEASLTAPAATEPPGLRVHIERVDSPMAEGAGPDAANLYNVSVSYDGPSGAPIMERYVHVTVKREDAGPNRIDRVLAAQSNLVTASFAPAPEGSSGNRQEQGDSAAGSRSPATKWLPFEGGVDSAMLAASDYTGDQSARTGMYQLEQVDLFNILCIPPDARDRDVDPSVYAAAANYCQQRRAMLLVDPPRSWREKAEQGTFGNMSPGDVGIEGTVARNAAVYFPCVTEADPLLKNGQSTFAPCGSIAGVWASTDRSRGVWKAAAGVEAGLKGVTGLERKLTDEQNGILNSLGINCLREFAIVGPVVWGARTMRGADTLEDDYKYIPVRRLTLFLEESIYRGTKWAVFEPNDEALWSQLRSSISSFMADLSRQGAFYGYQVICDGTTTSPSDIAQGIVRIIVAFAPVKPTEFVMIEIAQIAGQATA